MNSWLKLALILCAVVALCSLISHGAIRWFGIRSGHSGYQPYGRSGLKPTANLYCSSLGYSGIDWERVSEAMQGTIESWATAGSSPSEWEAEDRTSSGLTHTFIVVSPYDLNEHFLCDVRADVVPLRKAVRDLRCSGAGWEFSRRVLGQYPRMFVRKLFPTVGRSDGVMVGIRAKLRKLSGGRLSADAADAPKLGETDAADFMENVSDWSPGRLQRRIVLMRNACQGKHSFNGPKAIALQRLIKRAIRQGHVMMLVMPVSPVYHREFLTPSVMSDFERVLVELQHRYPGMVLLRLDRISSLGNNDMFTDFVHLSMNGQRIATSAFLNQLRIPARRQ